MGAKSSKTLKNNELREIGEKANREEPNSFHYSNTINLTNDIIVSQSKADPSLNFQRNKYITYFRSSKYFKDI